MYYAFVALQIIGLILSVIVVAKLIHADVTSGQNMMTIFMLMSVVQGTGYLFELLSKTQEAAMIAVRMEYLGSGLLVIFISRFFYVYCNAKEPKYLFQILEVIAAVCVVAVWTSDKHTLYYSKIVFEMEPTPHLVLSHGILYYVFMFGCTIMPYLIAEFGMIQIMRKESASKRRRHYRTIVGLSVLPITTVVLYSTNFTGYLDPIPPMMSIMLPLIILFIWYNHTYDMNKVAATAVIQEMTDCVVLLDEDRRITSYNKAAAKAFPGFSEASIGRSIISIPEFPLEVLQTEENVKIDHGERAYIGHSKKLDDPNRGISGYIVLMYDATENRRNTQKMVEVMQKAEQNSSMMAEFLNNIAQEIIVPMDAIAALTDLIIEESRGRKVYQFACEIKESAFRLVEMVEDITKLSRVEAGKISVVENGYNLKNLLSEVTDSMAIVAERKDLQFVCDIDDDIPCLLLGDENAVKEILINTINNAIRNTKEGYVKLVVRGTQRGGRVELSLQIEDTGIGLRQSDVRKVVEYYEGTDNSLERNVHDNGLGLALSKRYIELMNGNVQFESIYGEGTSITIVIVQRVMDNMTIGQYRKQNQDVKEEVLRMFSAPALKVLVVDDNLINRKVAVGMLSAYQCQIDEAESGKQAIDMITEKSYDIVFLDQMMPEMDGIETVRQINRIEKQDLKRAKIVALTANTREGAREMLLSNGFQDYLGKPVERGTLHRCMMRWVPEDMRIYRDEDVQAESESEVLLDDLDDIFMNGVNIAQAMKKHKGNLNDYLEILSLYYFDGLKKPQEFDQYLEQGNLESYRVLCHSVKGASSNIGAQFLSTQLNQLEKYAAAGDQAGIAEHHEEMLDGYMRILEEIRLVLLRKHYLKEDYEGDTKPITRGEVIEKLSQALMTLENISSKEALFELEHMQEYDISARLRDYLHDASMKIRMFADEEAKTLLRRAIEVAKEQND